MRGDLLCKDSEKLSLSPGMFAPFFGTRKLQTVRNECRRKWRKCNRTSFPLSNYGRAGKEQPFFGSLLVKAEGVSLIQEKCFTVLVVEEKKI